MHTFSRKHAIVAGLAMMVFVATATTSHVQLRSDVNNSFLIFLCSRVGWCAPGIVAPAPYAVTRPVVPAQSAAAVQPTITGGAPAANTIPSSQVTVPVLAPAGLTVTPVSLPILDVNAGTTASAGAVSSDNISSVESNSSSEESISSSDESSSVPCDESSSSSAAAVSSDAASSVDSVNQVDGITNNGVPLEPLAMKQAGTSSLQTDGSSASTVTDSTSSPKKPCHGTGNTGPGLCTRGSTLCCGNGVVDPGEECDNGGYNGDGCSTKCLISICGNGKIEFPEQCDDGNQNGKGKCDSHCLLKPACGDGIWEVGEFCDNSSHIRGCFHAAHCTDTCQCVNPDGSWGGDPHVITLDGRVFDVQEAGLTLHLYEEGDPKDAEHYIDIWGYTISAGTDVAALQGVWVYIKGEWHWVAPGPSFIDTLENDEYTLTFTDTSADSPWFGISMIVNMDHFPQKGFWPVGLLAPLYGQTPAPRPDLDQLQAQFNAFDAEHGIIHPDPNLPPPLRPR